MSETMARSQTTSSINAAWPPVPASYNRVRGFFSEAVLDERDAYYFTDAFRTYQRETADSSCDRLSIRTVMSRAALALVAREGIAIEGALPFSRCGEQLFLAYTGWNAENRRVSVETYHNHRDSLYRAVRRPRRTAMTPARLEQQNYTTHLIERNASPEERAALVSRFATLYEAFDYNADDVAELLDNPANTIAYIEQDGQIVSTAMAEAGVVDVKGIGPVHLAENTEAYTDPNHRQRGLYAAISGYVLSVVMNERREGRRDVDILYGESNLAMQGVLNAAHENGRRMNHFDAEELGLDGDRFGILPQNVKIWDGTETRTYNDLALTYNPLQEETV